MTDWASLNAQRDLASRLLGDTAQTALTDWYAQQVEMIDDPAFATEFYGHLKCPGTVPGEYNHRLVRAARGRLLGGIRFFGGDPARPFVEILAHTFEDDLSGLADMVTREWAGFSPRHLRVLLSPAEYTQMARPNVALRLDMSLHAARCGNMKAPDGRVSLGAFQDIDQAIALVTQRYADLAVRDPELAQNIGPETDEKLKDLHMAGGLHAIQVAKETVGLLAIERGKLAWIEGFKFMEEVVATQYQGQGFAVSGQSALAAALDPDSLLIGTIDGLNHPSRKTAQRAGRAAVLGYYFCALEAADST